MKQIILILTCLLIFIITSIAQVDISPDIDYEISLNDIFINDDNYVGSWGGDVLGIDNNEAFIVYNVAIGEVNDYTITNILAHLNSQGEITNKISFPNNDMVTGQRVLYIGKMDTPNAYLAMGSTHIEEERAFLITVFKFNKALEVEWEKVIDIFYYSEGIKYPEPNRMMFKCWNNTCYLAVSGHKWRCDQYQHATLYKMDLEGNILIKKDIYPADDFSEIRYISHIPCTNRFLMNQADRIATEHKSWIMSDENLEMISELVLPDPFKPLANFLDMEYINETEFIYSGRNIGFEHIHMGLRKGTVSNPQMKRHSWHWDRFDGIEGVCGGYYKTMAMQNNYLYYGMADQMYNGTNRLLLAAFNYELDSLWMAYLKDDAYYMFLSITPMTDGSCLIGTRRWFYDDNNVETSDAYFVKIKTPKVLQENSVAEQKESGAIKVYPNPTTGELRITNYGMG